MELVGLTPQRQIRALLPKAEKPPWKAASYKGLGKRTHFSNRFPALARKSLALPQRPRTRGGALGQVDDFAAKAPLGSRT